MLDTAVIPCGGLGTRLHPITRWLPKEMLPVALRPVLHWALDEAADAGLLRAIIITNPHKPVLEAVARSYPGPLDLEFVPQDHPRGLGDAFLRVTRPSRRRAFPRALARQPVPGPQSDRGGARRRIAPPDSPPCCSPRSLARTRRPKAPPGAPVRARERRHPPGDRRGGQGIRPLRRRRRRRGHADRTDGLYGRRAGAIRGGGARAARGRGARRRAGAAATRPSGRLAGVLSQARFFDVGVPEGYREAVATFPPKP